MIGSAIGAFASTRVTTPKYQASTIPGAVFVQSRAGSASSGLVTVNTVNGVGPYEYEWSITGSDISISSTDTESVTFTASGGATSFIETAKVDVKDTGNNDEIATARVNVTFLFENSGVDI